MQFTNTTVCHNSLDFIIGNFSSKSDLVVQYAMLIEV